MRWILFGLVVTLVLLGVLLQRRDREEGADRVDRVALDAVSEDRTERETLPAPRVAATPEAVETKPFAATVPEAFSVTVRVVSVTRRGLLPVEVAALSFDGDAVGRTDRDGMAVVRIPNHRRSGLLAASVTLRPIAETRLEFPRDDGAEIVLERRCTSGISGRAVDAGGRPLEGARCVLFEALYPPGRTEPVADASEEGALVTGADGTFRFTDVGFGPKRLVVTSVEPGRAVSTTVVLDTIADASTRDLDFDEERELGDVVLGGDGVLKVLVTSGGHPAAGLRVRVATYGDIARDVVATTDGEGRVEFSPLPERDLRLEPAEADRPFRPVRLFVRGGPSHARIAGDVSAFEARLREEAGEDLVVFTAGASVAVVREVVLPAPRDAVLWLEGDAASEVFFRLLRRDRGSHVVASGGRTTLPLERKVEAGDYRVIVGDGKQWFEARATVAEGGRTHVRVVLEPGVRVKGRLTKDGRPAKGVVVAALPDGTEFGERVPVVDGAFELVFPRRCGGVIAVQVDDRLRRLEVPPSSDDLALEAAY